MSVWGKTFPRRPRRPPGLGNLVAPATQDGRSRHVRYGTGGFAEPNFVPDFVPAPRDLRAPRSTPHGSTVRSRAQLTPIGSAVNRRVVGSSPTRGVGKGPGNGAFWVLVISVLMLSRARELPADRGAGARGGRAELAQQPPRWTPRLGLFRPGVAREDRLGYAVGAVVLDSCERQSRA